MIEVVLAMKQKLPISYKSKPLYIQQDNAGPHILGNDEESAMIAGEDGWDIRLKSQSPNSPDMNVVDLGFFHALQSIQYKHRASSIEEFVAAVTNAFEHIDCDRLDNVFLTLQQVMNSCMTVKGGNNYKFPHMQKKKLRANGNLLISIDSDQNAVIAAKNAIYQSQESSKQNSQIHYHKLIMRI